MHTETCKRCHKRETNAASLIKELEKGTDAIINIRINNILNQDMEREKSSWFHVGMKTSLIIESKGKKGDFMGVGMKTPLWFGKEMKKVRRQVARKKYYLWRPHQVIKGENKV